MFDEKKLKSNSESKQMLNDLIEMFSMESLQTLQTKLSDQENFSLDQVEKIEDDQEIINKIEEKLSNALNLTADEIVNGDKSIETTLENLMIDVNEIKYESEFHLAIKKYNEKIESLLSTSMELKNMQNSLQEAIFTAISDKEEFVNNFLKISGIPYEFSTKYIDRSYSSYIKHRECDDKMDAHKSLSYGEKNALALILFVLEVMVQDLTDVLIILDDPVSSFDVSKKFALFHYLFNSQDGYLKNKTVMLFTHDFLVVNDFLNKSSLKQLNPNLFWLDKINDEILQKNFTNLDYRKTHELWFEHAQNIEKSKLVRAVNLRRYFEAIKDSNTYKEEYNLICDLLKGRSFKVQRQNANDRIKEMINDFEYDSWKDKIHCLNTMIQEYRCSTSKVEKLQIMRNIIQLHQDGEVDSDEIITIEDNMMSFILNTYHIESAYIKGFIESENMFIPDYIVQACDLWIERELTFND